MTSKKPHSADVLNDTRDFWWNLDFLELMASRLSLDQVHLALDVGCGQGHWGHLILPYLAAGATLVGIDPEREWIQIATQRAQDKGFGEQTEYHMGAAESMPFPDNHFDLVTCQTVLIHVPDVSDALREMFRVLKPGGLLFVAEPNNSATYVLNNNLSVQDDVEDILQQVRMSLYCERGRESMGRGNCDRGDLIPGYFHEMRLRDIQVYLSDLADYYLPPYETTRERAYLGDPDDDNSEYWTNLEKDMKTFFIAGGGSLREFEKCWEFTLKKRDRMMDGLRNHTYCTAGGSLMYLVSGRKSE